MDPISQGAVGAVAAQTLNHVAPKHSLLRSRESIAALTWLGCAAGMAPDLDVLIQSPTDPLLFLEFHRHFTHALVFIPVGALIVAGALYRLVRDRLSFSQAYLACLLGYATHGLLDACTSYGTQLFWPFADTRVAWNNVSVVDPFFTLPLLALVIVAYRTRRPAATFAGIAWALAYLAFGVVQMERAYTVAEALADARGHTANRLTMKASFGNLLVWKSIYEHNGRYYVDGIRTGTAGSVCPGESVPRLNIDAHLPFLDRESQQARDLERFRWFSDDYLTPIDTPGAVTDMRYSMVPNQVEPMWGVTLQAGAPRDAHVQWWTRRDMTATRRAEFWALLRGDGCESVESTAGAIASGG